MLTPVPRELLGAHALAERLGVTYETIRQYKLQGMPTAGKSESGKRDLYDPVECAVWKTENKPIGGRGGKRGGGDDDEDSPVEALNAARLRKETAMAEKAELENQQKLGQVVWRRDVEKVWTSAVRLIGSRLDNVASRVAPDILGFLGVSDVDKRIAVEQMIRRELDAAREEMKSAGVVTETE